MATASVPNTFVNGTAADAVQVNANFTNVVNFLNNSVIHRDGSKSMTGAFDAGSQKLTNLAVGTADSDGVRLSQVPLVGYATRGTSLVVTTSAQNVGSAMSFTAPAAGMARVDIYASITCAGANYSSGFADLTVTFSIDGVSTLTVDQDTHKLAAFADGTYVRIYTLFVPVASGANSFQLQATRSGTATGGSATLAAGCRIGLTVFH